LLQRFTLRAPVKFQVQDLSYLSWLIRLNGNKALRLLEQTVLKASSFF
jgi:hypothetical protein